MHRTIEIVRRRAFKHELGSKPKWSKNCQFQILALKGIWKSLIVLFSHRVAFNLQFLQFRQSLYLQNLLNFDSFSKQFL